MTGLDLRRHAPRSPYERLDGLVFMPRTIDKIRATLPGGDLGPYLITPGLSNILLAMIGIPLNALRAVVIVAMHDDQIAAWLRHHTDTAQYEPVNRVLASRRNADVPTGERDHFESLYPQYLRAQYPVLFDLLVADDRELYPALQHE